MTRITIRTIGRDLSKDLAESIRLAVHKQLDELVDRNAHHWIDEPIPYTAEKKENDA